MQVKKLVLQNFRNYESVNLELDSKINIFIGDNGQGKTNLAESLIFLSEQISHRTNLSQNLVRKDAEKLEVKALVSLGNREVTLGVRYSGRGNNEYLLNGNKTQARYISQNLTVVSSSPEDLQIIRGEPSLRRGFVDEVLTKRYPAARSVISDYEKVLKQRNATLKKLGATNSTNYTELEFWDEQLAELGSRIIFHRRAVISKFRDPLQKMYKEISGKEHTTEIYIVESLYGKTDVSRETFDARQDNVSRETILKDFKEKISAVRLNEVQRGQTLVGPHRDEIALMLNTFPVKGNASHGETWSYVISLKLALAKLVAEDSATGFPLIILDDVFSELDTSRRKNLAQILPSFGQVIITAAVYEDVPESLAGRVFKIVSGEVVN